MQHHFTTFEEKCFHLSNIAQDLPLLTDMHAPTPAHILNVLQLLVQDL